MVHKCCIASCGLSVRNTGSKGLSYHAFPVKEPNRDKWLQAVLPHVEKPEMFRIVQGYTRICSRHFKKKDYSIDSRKRARLSSHAVPSGFPGRDLREASQPIRIEKIDNAQKKKLTISPTGHNLSPKELVRSASGEENESRIEFDFTVPLDSSVGQQSQPLSEDDTASSTFSSQEEYYVNRQHVSTGKSSGKVRKRRKHRLSSLPVSLSSCKKRSAAEDLNIEGVGDALAEINLSPFISRKSDLIRDTKNMRKPTSPSVTPFGTIKVEPLFLHPAEPISFTTKRAMPKQGDDNDTNNATFLASPKKEQPNFEQDLLNSIQAVSIGPNVTPDSARSKSPVLPTHKNESISLDQFISSSAEEESLVSSHLHDLYADLVNGGASLSLEDSTATIFDSQLLIDALQGVVDDLGGSTSIDQLTGEFDSFLSDALTSPSLLTVDESPVPENIPLRKSLTKSNSDICDALLSVDQKNRRNIINVEKSNAVRDATPLEHESPCKRNKEESDSSPECDDLSSTPTRSRKKSRRREKSSAVFSVERFRDSNKDIEYYTGFPNFQRFDAFFTSIESYVENLKVTDMVYGVANLGLSSAEDPAVTADVTPEVVNDLAPTVDEPKRRLSQGRSMSRMDEMFMTIVRLRRKIPEKVIGHMFCISQPSVSRIIRAWTMLLSKILEMTRPGKPSTKSNQNQVPSTVSTVENSPERSTSQSKNKGCESNQQSQMQLEHEDIPASFRQLFYSELAQTIICSGNAALNSRKTSSSTKCPNISRSKRPKKEKPSSTAVTDEAPSPAPEPLPEETVPIVDEKFVTIPMSPAEPETTADEASASVGNSEDRDETVSEIKQEPKK